AACRGRGGAGGRRRWRLGRSVRDGYRRGRRLLRGGKRLLLSACRRAGRLGVSRKAAGRRRRTDRVPRRGETPGRPGARVAAVGRQALMLAEALGTMAWETLPSGWRTRRSGWRTGRC